MGDHYVDADAHVRTSCLAEPDSWRRWRIPWDTDAACKGVFTLVTRSRVLTSASKFNIEPNGEIFDVSPENDHASPNVKTLQRIQYETHLSTL